MGNGLKLESMVDTGAIEVRIARFSAILVPLFALVLISLTRPYWGYLITLDKNILLRDHPSFFLDRGSVIAFLGISCLPLGWLVSLMIERRLIKKVRPDLPFGGLAAVLIVAALCILYQDNRVSRIFYEAAKFKTENFSLARSVVFWRTEGLQQSSFEVKRSGILLMGSSQMNFAVDTQLLTERLGNMNTAKKTLPGFGIMQYSMALPDIAGYHPEVVVCMLSEFDAFRDDRLPVSRLRYFSCVENVRGLAEILPWRLMWENRAEMADLSFASLIPLWRDRDLFRHVFERFWKNFFQQNGKAGGQSGDKQDDILRPVENLRKEIRNTDLLESNFRSFRSFVEELRRRGIKLYVCEGRLYPFSTAVYPSWYRVETRKRLKHMADELGFYYVSERDMPGFSEDDFVDAYHFNEKGRKKFSEFLADYIAKHRA